MSLIKNLLRPNVELIVIRDIFNPSNNIEAYTGRDIELLLKQAFGGNGLSDSVRLYHGNLLDEVTPKTPDDVDRVMRLHGRIYAVVKPMGLDPFSWAVIGLSVLVSVAVAFLMPVPTIPNQSNNQPQSPNNALAARTNKQRLGGRIPDIYGTVWSVPDLLAPTYSIYVDNREVEIAYMCVGRGRFNVTKALDDTTPINEVFGSSVLIYNPDKTLDDEPDFSFGGAFAADEAELTRLAVKRYTSVNGQELLPINEIYSNTNLTIGRDGSVYHNSIGDFTDRFSVGEAVYINQEVDKDGYNFSGSYIIDSVFKNRIILKKPWLSNPDWQRLVDNNIDMTGVSATVTADLSTIWQGYFYTSDNSHNFIFINLVANNGLYLLDQGDYESLGIPIEIESQIVDSQNNPISGTMQLDSFVFYGAHYNDYAVNNGAGQDYGSHWRAGRRTTNNEVTQSAAMTYQLRNTYMAAGKRLRFRVRRSESKVVAGQGESVVQDVKIADFYGARNMTASDYPKGVTTLISKSLATEGALSLKERKLRLLVQRYVTDATSGLPKLSNRADDILRDIATDPKIGNLQLSQVDIAQIKAEIDAQIAYFGTDKCSEFCGTFDDNNLSAEETMQIVAKAVFSQAKRQGNKIMLDFERKVPASVAVFNSHNILPDTFTAPQSLGIANDYDGVKVEYTDPVDDAIITMTYPNDAITNPHEDKLIGVRNKVQAHTHMMRMYNKDRHAYKSCEFVAGDESNIVVRTNRITVADQLRADVQQGSVDSIETIGGDIVLHTTDPVTIEPSGAYTMFIQTINNGVESIAVTARDDYSVKLARLPSGEISGTDKAVQAVYQVVSETDDNRDAYLVAQKDPSDGMTNKLLCTNYDDRYYQNDSDFIDGLITVN